MATPSVQFPFPCETPYNVPSKWESDKPRVFDEIPVEQLAEGIGSFYARFFSPDCCREDKTVYLPKPDKFPSSESVEKFKLKLIGLISEDIHRSIKVKGIWTRTFRTHYYPEDQLVNKACNELEIEFQNKPGFFFPMKSSLSVELREKTLTVSWVGKRIW